MEGAGPQRGWPGGPSGFPVRVLFNRPFVLLAPSSVRLLIQLSTCPRALTLEQGPALGLGHSDR